MNRDWREKRIKQLFHEVGAEDERRAPGFERVLQAALTRSRGPGGRLRLWRLAAVAAMTVLAVVVALWRITSHSSEPAPSLVGLTTLELPGSETGPTIMGPSEDAAKLQSMVREVQDLSRPPIYMRAARRGRPASPTYNSTVLISQWQSPTNFLLRVPGNELLKSLPRVPDPSSGITKSLIEKHN